MNFTPVDKMLSKIQYNPSSVDYGRFFKCLRKYTIYKRVPLCLGFKPQLYTKNRVMNETQLYVYSGQYSRLLTLNVRIHILFIVKQYLSCSSRPSPASLGRMAIEAKLTFQYNLSLFSKIIEHCHFAQNFTPVVVKMRSKIQSSTSPEGYGHLSNVYSKKGIILKEKKTKNTFYMFILLFKRIRRLVNSS